ncbi:MAG: protein kinase [Kofleriaceae bacterium]|nr:protein kinase [Kofleriaceae bacterium]
MPHPSVHDLLAADDPAVADHLVGCAACRRVVARARPLTAPIEAPATSDDDALPLVDPAVYERVDGGEARGGMGRTYRARDRRIGREVTLKQPLGPAEVADPVLRATLRARFEREARLTARLEHPAIVAVHEVGRFVGGDVFYAMRRVQGAPLGELIAARPRLAERLALLPNLILVAEALAYAHGQGVTHRDVTPANIMIGAFGETVLIDWGLAADAEGAGAVDAAPYRAGELPLTAYGVGTPGYMAPEQARGVRADARADVYALGATLYHLIAGQPPEPSPRPLPSRCPDAPPPLVTLIARAMDPDPAARPASAAEVAAELSRFTAGQLMASHRYSPGELARYYLRRFRLPIAIGGLALVVVAVIGGLAVRGLARSRASTERARQAAETSERAAQQALRRQLGVTAAQLADEPARRIDALAAGVAAVAPEVAAGQPPLPEAWHGLVVALAAAPIAAPLPGRVTISNAAFSADGQRLVTVGIDHQLLQWDAATGRAIGARPLALDRPLTVALAAAPARALVCGLDPVAELHPLDGGPAVAVPLTAPDARCAIDAGGRAVVAAGREVLVLDRAGAVAQRGALDAAATALAIAPDGLIAIGTVAGAIALWRPAAGAPVAFAAHPGGTQALRFTDGGARLISGGADGRALAWPIAGDRAGAAEGLVDGWPGPISMIHDGGGGRIALGAPRNRTDQRAVDTVLIDGAARRTLVGQSVVADGRGDARLIASTTVDRVRLVDPADGGDALVLPPAAPHVVVLARFGARALVAAASGEALLWDLRSGAASGTLLGHTGSIVGAVALGETLWTAATDGTIRAWSLRAGDADAAPRTFALGAEALALATTTDGDAALVIDTDGGIWRLGGPTGGAALVHRDASAGFAALGPDGATLVFGGAGGRATLAPAGRAVVALIVPGAADLTAGALAPAGRTIAVGAADGTVAVIDAATGAARSQRVLAAKPEARPVGIARIAFTPDGATLIVGDAAAHAWLVDAATLAVRQAIDARLGGAATDALHRRGLQVGFAPDGAVHLYPLAGGAPTVLRGHGRAVVAAAASADGARLATADLDGEVRVWALSPAPGAAATLALPGRGAVTTLTFVDGDRAIAIAGASGGLQIVPVDPALAVARACARLAHFGRAADGCASP